MTRNYGPLHFDQRHAQSFEAWREWWFDYLCRPNEFEAQGVPYWRLEVESRYEPFGSATRAGEALIKIFGTSSDLVSKFGREATAEGLWKIAQALAVKYGHSLWDADADAQVVERALAAMPRLFADTFAPHCDAAMSSSGSETTNPINSACYMWFDIIGLDHCDLNEITDERIQWSLRTLTAVLEIPHLACQESALHGLGHIAYFKKSALVRPIIREFLGRNRKIPAKLRAYAEFAAGGHVQ